MKEITITASYDSPVYGWSSSFSTARTTATAIGGGGIASVIQVSGGEFLVWRGFLSFDTSLIPVSAKILKVELTVTPSNIYGTPGSAYVLKNDWSDYDPMSEEGFSTPFSNALSAAKDLNHFGSMTVDTAQTKELATAWVNKRTKTYYTIALDIDYDNSQPGATIGYAFYAISDAEAKRPKLTIQYEPRPSTCVGILY